MEQAMSDPIEFYFDFSSPYGYLAACDIDTLAARHGRTARWHPYLMGVALKATGRVPLVEVPMVADYSRRDIERSARLAGQPLRLPEKFPIAGIAPSRAYYWLARTGPEERAHVFALALMQAYFAHGRDIGDPATVIAIGTEQGLDAQALESGLQDQEVKDRLRQETDAAMARGIFGSPFFIVDGEPFWGHDRMPHVERWLETGGW
jgi:2-hydroxychromene-2-carboxylate isomerase